MNIGKLYDRLLDAAKDQPFPTNELKDCITAVENQKRRNRDRYRNTPRRRRAHDTLSLVYGMDSFSSSQVGTSSNGNYSDLVGGSPADSPLRST